MITAQQVDEMTRGYITAALWADCVPLRCEHCGGAGADPDAETSVLCPVCEGADPEESGGLQRLDVDAESRRYVWALCRYFADLYADDLEVFAALRCFDAGEGTVWDYIGHDLRLTSGGHGTGFWDRDSIYHRDPDPAHSDAVAAFQSAKAALTTASQLAPFSRIGGGDCFQTGEETACIDVGLDRALFRQRAMAQGYPDPQTGEAFSSAQRQHWVETGDIVEQYETLAPELHHVDCDYRNSSAAKESAETTGVDVEENREIYPCNLGCVAASPMKTAIDFVPRYDEDVARCWAALLIYIAEDLGAPLFAADMAAGGCGGMDYKADNLAWRAAGFEPAQFADVLFEVLPTFSFPPNRERFFARHEQESRS